MVVSLTSTHLYLNTHVCHINHGCQILTSTHLTTPSIFETYYCFTPELFSRQKAQREANLLLIDWLLYIAKLPLISRS